MLKLYDKTITLTNISLNPVDFTRYSIVIPLMWDTAAWTTSKICQSLNHHILEKYETMQQSNENEIMQ